MSVQQHHHRHHAHHQENEPEHMKKHSAKEDAIRVLAYELYCKSGGFALDNWLEAEQLLKGSGKK